MIFYLQLGSDGSDDGILVDLDIFEENEVDVANDSQVQNSCNPWVVGIPARLHFFAFSVFAYFNKKL